MAQGSVTSFEEFTKYIGDGSHDLDTDSFKVMLITNATVPTAGDLTPDSADYTEVTGGTEYVAGGIALTVTWTEAAGTSTFAITNSPTWAKDVAGPTNIYYAVVYNTSHAGTNDAIAFIDMTTDAGTTPVSLQDGQIVINAGTLFTVAKA